jgi:hypothetical protein
MMCGCYDFQNPPHGASRQLMIAKIVGAGTSFSLLPCQAYLYSYTVAIAHYVEVEIGDDRHASAHPPPGPPPAGAGMCSVRGWGGSDTRVCILSYMGSGIFLPRRGCTLRCVGVGCVLVVEGRGEW